MANEARVEYNRRYRRDRYHADPEYRAATLARNTAWRETHREQVAAQKRMRYLADRERVLRQRTNGRYRFAPEAWDAMYTAQGGRCAVCGDPGGTDHGDGRGISDRLHVDHDHLTGAVRGLVCRHCNLGLGYFKDDSRRLHAAIQYLEDRDRG